MPRIRGREDRGRSSSRTGLSRRHQLALVAAISVLLAAIGAGVAFGADAPTAEEAALVAEPAAGAPGPTAATPTSQQTMEALQAAKAEHLGEAPETDPKVAEELPHRDLDGGEALELAEGVFGARLEEPAGIYDELEPEKFLSDYAAVVPASTLPESPTGVTGRAQAPSPLAPVQPVFVESTLPLRTRNAEGEEEAVDLTLQSPEGQGGELRPQNPLTELAIPAHLGEGISVGDVQIEVAGAAEEASPTNVGEQYAFYPNVAENTDLVVAPTPTGVETMTDIRSAEAPTTTTYELSLPAGAELKASEVGGAEVLQGGRTTMTIPPPTATDAAGEPVPVELEVSGGSLRVAVSPGPEASLPILVDPEFIQEAWYWSSKHDSLAAWSAGTTQWSICPVPYALWMGPSVPGLGLTSGCDANPVPSGTNAYWSYLVPRYQADIAKFGTAPSSFVYQLYTQGVIFLPYGNYKPYPVLLWGIVDPTTGWDVFESHYGGQGEMANWSTGFASTNLTAKPGDKGAYVSLATFENEAPTVRRDAFVGEAIVSVADMEPPVLKKLEAPERWLDTTAEPIAYEVEDTGLGVQAAWASYEGSPETGWGFNLGCAGTVANPCPRLARSGETAALAYDPKSLPTGKDTVAVAFGDVVFGPSGGAANHATAGAVTLKIDHTAPGVELSGPLTEQESLGTLQSEYPLTIKATDGTEADPQSGVAKVEVKVDGKTEQTWNPGCATENCSFSGSWTLKTSEYSAESHEVEVLVTDAAGVVSENTLDVELGEAPPQTSFTSPHPSHETTAISSVAFKATEGGAPVEGATFRCSLDGASATPCATPYELPEHFDEGPHDFTVAAVNKSGKADPTPASWSFETAPYPAAPPDEKLVFPEVGKKTASYYTLEAEWGANPEGKAGAGVRGVTFQMELPGWKTFRTVPAGCTIDGSGKHVSWPLPVHSHPGHNAPVYLRVRGCPAFEEAGYPEKEIQFRALFDGGEKVVGASAPATTEFVSRANANRVSTDATEAVGPATVDLLTGAFSLSRTDVSLPVPGYEANLEFTRTYNSTIDESLPGYSKVLGGAWQPATPLESEYEGEAWTRIEEQVILPHPAVYEDECWEMKVRIENEEEVEYPAMIACPAASAERCNGFETCEEWEVEAAQPKEEWIELFDNEGAAVIFQIAGVNYIAPEYAKELRLTKREGNFVLAYPNGTHTTFTPNGPHVWLPTFISYQANSNSTRMVYHTEPEGRGLNLVEEIAPAAVPCEEETARKTPGCRSLVFEYSWAVGAVTCYLGVVEPCQNRLLGIKYYGPSGSEEAGVTVAEYHYEKVPGPEGLKEMVLGAESDPRLPGLAESYKYAATPDTHLLTSLTPPGQTPWEFAYENGPLASRLRSVGRSGMASTIAYEVPVEGPGAPYSMSAESIASWGQTDLPVDATAIFPPNHVPSEYPPHEYAGATIHYMDPEGHEVNTASPSPPGVSGSTIATTETDVHGNVVRELDPQNRLVALGSANPVARSHELDTHSVYNANGTEMLESWGPLHEVRLESGELEQARQHTVTRYDEGAPTPQPGTPPAFLPTKETVAAVVPGKEGEFEPRVTLTSYEWKHRLPEETIVDPGGLDIRTVTKYYPDGQVEETRQPKGVSGGTAGDTRTLYYSPPGTAGPAECISAQYANLPCEVLPAAQASGTGRKQLDVKKFLAYNYLDEPESVTEAPANTPAEARKTTTTYDAAGRQVTTKILGGGTALARTKAGTKTLYDPLTGAPIKQEFLCEEACTGFDNQATTTTYNALGQVTGYEDADGNKAETAYDAYGRPVTITDGKGAETLHYDEASGLLTGMEVSGVGTFTAAYDADGDLIERGLPNGLTAKTTYNQAGEPTNLAYTKTSSCGENGCTWYSETLERSIEGRILYGASSLYGTSSLVEDRYSYDKAGRLTEAQETPAEGLPEEGGCTSRRYTYDADSNRLSKTIQTVKAGLPCAISEGETQSYEYDEADRLIGPTYDAWGRITTLPEGFAGDKELKTSYFANDMVATQEQNSVTNTFQLDSTGRQRRREQTGGVSGVEIFHYDGPGDSPSWTSLGTTWSRNVPGIGGELAAVQESNGTTTFELTDLHGDVVASASSSPTATSLLATYRFDEFGEPEGSSSAGRFAWLGGKSRRTELSSGVIQMGARSYIPELGRFLTPDPIPGGSANAYDYADQDPLNNLDLGGTKKKKKKYHDGGPGGCPECGGHSTGHHGHSSGNHPTHHGGHHPGGSGSPTHHGGKGHNGEGSHPVYERAPKPKPEPQEPSCYNNNVMSNNCESGDPCFLNPFVKGGSIFCPDEGEGQEPEEPEDPEVP